MKKLFLALLGLFVFIFLIVFFRVVPDYLWFDSIGKLAVWKHQLLFQIGFFVLGTVVAGTWLFLNLAITSWLLKRYSSRSTIEFRTASSILNQLLNSLFRYSQQTFGPAMSRTIDMVTLIVASGFSILFGMVMMEEWPRLVLVRHVSAYGVLDPIFSKDISFYLINLPVMNFLHAWSLWLLGVSFVMVFFVYFAKKLLFVLFGQSRDVTVLRWHLGGLLAVFCAVMALGAWLDRFDVLFSSSGVVYGAGYADCHVRLPLKGLMIGLWIVECGLVLFWVKQNKIRPALIGLGILVVVGILGGQFLPNTVQAYTVAPNELNLEKPFLKHSIQFTRLAYGIDSVKSQYFPVSNTLNYNAIKANDAVLRNVRLWDEEPLRKTFGQVQEIRQYYEFKKIDVDRYKVDGDLRQVLLSPRELDIDQLSSQAQTWVNRHLVYTHGYGLCMSPVNEVSQEGLPSFYIKNIPSVLNPNFVLTRPELYFSEQQNHYALVNTAQPEFDYPKGDTNVYTSYKGKGGVLLDSVWKRLVYALKFSDVKLLISTVITDKSRLLYDRDIDLMVRNVAPFLRFDRDPYLVLSPEGRLIWVLDAYTTSDYFPYSEPFSDSLNYIRHAVKVTVDAYDGDMRFYKIDDRDPLIAGYSKAFPDLFLSISEMPAFLNDHWRYPKDYFVIQSAMFCTYHMTDPQVFYNKEDVWAFPEKTEPYYMVTKLPGRGDAQFVLATPFTPANKHNIVSWMSVVCDAKGYGEKTVFKFPKEKTVYGPIQLESRIDQDTEISQKLTLWGQVGSTVIRGDLMVIPIENSLVYIEPIYLQSTQSQLPELKRVIFSYNDRVVMGDTLQSAIAGCFNGYLPTEVSTMTTEGLDDRSVLKEIRNRYEKLRDLVTHELNLIDQELKK